MRPLVRQTVDGVSVFSLGTSVATVRGGEGKGGTTLWPDGVEDGISAFGAVREGAKDRLFGDEGEGRKGTGWREERANEPKGGAV